MHPRKKIVIIAGEESGDQLAAALIRELLKAYPNLDISGIGGEHMQSCGMRLLVNLARYGVTGLVEVIRHLGIIRHAEKTIRAHLLTHQPDLVVLVDYPGFNLRLAKFIKKNLNTRILYYISPQIWAWKAGRIDTIKACIDHMAVILPFEKQIYCDAKVPVSFVGHPLVKQLTSQPAASFKPAFPSNKRLIALLPGSRVNEIKHHMPILYEAAMLLCRVHDDLHFVIPVAQTLALDFVQSFWLSNESACTFMSGHAIDVIQQSDCVVVASGTASLQCALINKPMCIIYKASAITYMVVSQVIRVRYLGLCNLLMNKMVVPELMQNDCNPQSISDVVHQLLTDTSLCQRMHQQLASLSSMLSNENADISLKSLVSNMLFNANQTPS